MLKKWLSIALCIHIYKITYFIPLEYAATTYLHVVLHGNIPNNDNSSTCLIYCFSNFFLVKVYEYAAVGQIFYCACFICFEDGRCFNKSTRLSFKSVQHTYLPSRNILGTHFISYSVWTSTSEVGWKVRVLIRDLF